jgi:hypothetical protein
MYTPLMKQAVKTIKIPKDFKIDIQIGRAHV